MALHLQRSFARTTSSLNDVQNDTGRVAFCGPYVLSAITGYPVSRMEAEISRFRTPHAGEAGAAPGDRRPIVRGTYTEEVAAALDHFGFAMVLKESHMHLERKARPSVWSWMQKPRNAWAHYILAVHKGKEGHWILIKGVKLCDTYSEGKWQFVVDGPHKGARIMEVFEVKRHLLPEGVAERLAGVRAVSELPEEPGPTAVPVDVAAQYAEMLMG